MAASYLLTPRAVDDLDQIWNFIARESPAAAARVESAIFEAFAGLARHPLLGSKREEITSLPVRFWAVSRYRSYVVVYRPEAKPIRIISVLHSKRNMKALLSDPQVL